MKQIELDTSFLFGLNVINYSLMIEIGKCNKKDDKEVEKSVGEIKSCEKDSKVFYLGLWII